MKNEKDQRWILKNTKDKHKENSWRILKAKILKDEDEYWTTSKKLVKEIEDDDWILRSQIFVKEEYEILTPSCDIWWIYCNMLMKWIMHRNLRMDKYEEKREKLEMNIS